ncbi:MAG: hypothetical protein ABI693_23490 [Bryobacteraceae bacterium]
MADFRKFLPALALSALVAIGSMPAAAQLTCNTNSSGTPTVRGEGRTELVGDILLTCTTPVIGGSPTTVVATVLRVLLNTPITSPYSGTIPAGVSDAKLIINDNVPAAVGYLPASGRQTASNVLEWYNVPVISAGSSSNTLRIVNVRADATAVVSINPNVPPSLIPSQIVAFLSADPSSALPINNPQQVVAYAKQSLTTSVSGSLSYRQCLSAPVPTGVADPETGFLDTTGSISLNFSETFTNAFKQAIDPARGVVDSVPGAAYSDESGFVVGGVGLADSGTPFRVKFDNIPTGATVYVTTQSTGIGNPNSTVVTATLNAAAIGSNTWTALTATGGSATADYYVMDALVPTIADLNTVTVYAQIAYTADPANNIPSTTGAAMTVTLSYGPGLSTARVPYSLPSFSPTATTSAGNLVSISPCVTNLLFPYVVSDGANFDTGVAIANTSMDGADGDIFATHTSGQTGSCKIWFFGTGAPSGPQTTPTIAAGSVYGFSLYSGDSTNGASIAPIAALTKGGYAIAKCNFQFAHGYAFIQNVGLPTKFAQSYLALVIPDRGGARVAQDASTSGGDSGEQLAQ